MKRGCIEHPKMYRLARLAGIRHRDAVAIVEMLHHWTAKYVPRGDVGRHDDAELAAAVEWEASDGTPEQIVKALADAGWIDRDPEHRLLVHDWAAHCDSWVHIALARAKQTFANGEVPKRARIGGEERKQLDLFWHAYEQQRLAQPELLPVAAFQEAEIRAHGVRTACALPSPTPSPLPSREGERESDARAREAVGFGPGEETPPPDELGEGERAAIRLWALTHAPSRITELIQLEQACFAYARSHGRTSSDWVNEVKLWILRQSTFERAPAPGARPSEDTRAASREQRDRSELNAERRRKQLEEWQREKDEEAGQTSEAREEIRRKYLRGSPSEISLPGWVDRKVASG